MSFFSAYIKEREDLNMVESSYGFATYKFRQFDCYLQDIYVVPEKRRTGEAKRLAKSVSDIAKAAGYSILTGSIDYRAHGALESEKALQAYGMKPYQTVGQVKYFFKEI